MHRAKTDPKSHQSYTPIPHTTAVAESINGPIGPNRGGSVRNGMKPWNQVRRLVGDVAWGQIPNLT
jgi:hypothetical protein